MARDRHVGELGTIEWVRRTGGVLRLRDRATMVAQAGIELASLPFEVSARFGHLPPKREFPRPPCEPTTVATLKAKEVCAEASRTARWLAPHSLRTFQFAQLFASAGGVDYDPEVLWVAAMTHDLGLVDSGRRYSAGASTCFSARSASEAYRIVEQCGWSAERRQRLATAISIHINVRVSRRTSPEGHLINLGSALDVAGTRLRAVYSDMLESVLAATPPGDFTDAIRMVWQAEAEGHRKTRAAFLQTAGLPLLIRTSPVARLASNVHTRAR